MRSILLLLPFVLVISCSSKKDSNTTTNVNLKEGTWRIAYYWDQKDETANFAGYALMFADGGSLMAHKGTSVYTGTWSETSTKLILTFSDPLLSDLNNDWLIVEKTSGMIKLKEDNPAQDDQLHLAKN
jgi:hypothetical protein